ncbi:MAG: hypothetical protein ACR2OX_08350 [Methyloligellaceae bacterium]
MNNQDPPQQPNDSKCDDKKRWKREKAEDDRRYQHYVETGEYVSHEEMMEWLDQLERDAEAKL